MIYCLPFKIRRVNSTWGHALIEMPQLQAWSKLCDENCVFTCVCPWRVSKGQVKTLKCFHCNKTLIVLGGWKGQAKGAEISECAEFLSPKRFALIRGDKFLSEKCNHMFLRAFSNERAIPFVIKLNRKNESGRRSNRFFRATMVKHSDLLVTLQNFTLSSIFAFSFNFHLDFELSTQCSNCKIVCTVVQGQL